MHLVLNVTEMCGGVVQRALTPDVRVHVPVDVDEEQEGFKHKALGYALVDWGWGGAVAVYCWRNMNGTRREQYW